MRNKDIAIGEIYGNLISEAMVIGSEGDHIAVIERRYGKSQVQRMFIRNLDFHFYFPYIIFEVTNCGD